MPLLLPPPEVQFLDGNGHPFAGGSVAFYIWGTDTPKDTWQDHEGVSLNTNPVILDAAGRALIFGSGDYRCVLKDASGNLIYDQWTSSVVSDAMQPVVRAETLEEARDLLGIDDAIQVETDRATAAEANLQTQITAEVARATGIEDGLRTDLDAEIARATAREDELEGMITTGTIPSLQYGTGVTDGGTGMQSVTFDTAFSATPVVVATLRGSSLPAVWLAVNPSTTGFTIWSSIPLADDAVHPISAAYNWIATGAVPL